jgi:hypothetical protein
MANFGALGTLRHAYRTPNKPSTSALVRSVSVKIVEIREIRHNTRLQRNEVARSAEESSEPHSATKLGPSKLAFRRPVVEALIPTSSPVRVFHVVAVKVSNQSATLTNC